MNTPKNTDQPAGDSSDDSVKLTLELTILKTVLDMIDRSVTRLKQKGGVEIERETVIDMVLGSIESMEDLVVGALAGTLKVTSATEFTRNMAERDLEMLAFQPPSPSAPEDAKSTGWKPQATLRQIVSESSRRAKIAEMQMLRAEVERFIVENPALLKWVHGLGEDLKDRFVMLMLMRNRNFFERCVKILAQKVTLTVEEGQIVRRNIDSGPGEHVIDINELRKRRGQSRDQGYEM